MFIFKLLFLVGLVLEEWIRWPASRQRRRDRKEQRILADPMKPANAIWDGLAFGGLEIFPLLYVFTPWLDFADYDAPTWVNWVGVVIFACALWLLWQAHRTLGRQWSASLAIQAEHRLIQEGVYQSIRHPIYAALWLTALAQACMLSNWLAGFAGLLCFAPFYFVRVPLEEQSLLLHFGEPYQHYMAQTGRVLPRFGK